MVGALGAAATWVMILNETPVDWESSLESSGVEAGLDAGGLFGDGRVLYSGALSAMVVGAWRSDKRLQSFGRRSTTSLVVTSAAVWGTKLSVARRRPNGGAYSFPSGHTATAFCAVPVVWHSYGAKLGVAALGLATLTGLDRMEDRKHYLSDVIAGATLGIVIGDLVASRNVETRFPQLAVVHNGMALTIRF